MLKGAKEFIPSQFLSKVRVLMSNALEIAIYWFNGLLL